MFPKIHEEFKKLNRDFKNMLKNVSQTEIDSAKLSLLRQQFETSLRPFLFFAELIKDLPPDTDVCKYQETTLKVIDFQMLLSSRKLIKSGSEDNKNST